MSLERRTGRVGVERAVDAAGTSGSVEVLGGVAGDEVVRVEASGSTPSPRPRRYARRAPRPRRRWPRSSSRCRGRPVVRAPSIPCAKRLLGDVLRVEVDGELHVVAGLGASASTDVADLDPRLSTRPSSAPACRGAPTRRSARCPLLPMMSSHLVAVALVRRVLLVVDLADVPEHVRRRGSPAGSRA